MYVTYEPTISDERARRAFARAPTPAPLQLRAPAGDPPSDAELLAAEASLQSGQLRAALERYEHALQRAEASGASLPVSARFNLHVLASGYGHHDTAQLAAAFAPASRATREELAAFWELRILIDDDDDRLHHARVYLDRARSPRDREEHEAQALAELTAAQLLWTRSCPPSARVDGLCLSRRATQWRTNCDTIEEVLEVVSRDPEDSRLSIAHRGRALALARRAARRYGDSDVLRRVHAGARFLAAEAELEAYYAIEAPRGRSFTVDHYKRDSGVPQWEREYQQQCRDRRQALRRYQEFSERATPARLAILRQYDELLAFEDPQAVLAVHARAAQLLLRYRTQLVLMTPQATPDDIHSYTHCADSLPHAYMERAQRQLARCLELATEHHYFDPWARLCESMLSAQAPDLYPPLRESFADRRPAPAKSIGVVTELAVTTREIR